MSETAKTFQVKAKEIFIANHQLGDLENVNKAPCF